MKLREPRKPGSFIAALAVAIVNLVIAGSAAGEFAVHTHVSSNVEFGVFLATFIVLGVVAGRVFRREPGAAAG